MLFLSYQYCIPREIMYERLGGQIHVSRAFISSDIAVEKSTGSSFFAKIVHLQVILILFLL